MMLLNDFSHYLGWYGYLSSNQWSDRRDPYSRAYRLLIRDAGDHWDANGRTYMHPEQEW